MWPVWLKVKVFSQDFPYLPYGHVQLHHGHPQVGSRIHVEVVLHSVDVCCDQFTARWWLLIHRSGFKEPVNKSLELFVVRDFSWVFGEESGSKRSLNLGDTAHLAILENYEGLLLFRKDRVTVPKLGLSSHGET